MLSLILLLAITHSAVAQLKYNIAFYNDKTCGKKIVTGDDWIPGTCYPVIPYIKPTLACAAGLATFDYSKCEFGMGISFGAKLTENSPGKQVTITGSFNSEANYGTCGAANVALLASNAQCSLCVKCYPDGECSVFSGKVCCSSLPAICKQDVCVNAPSYDCDTAYKAGETCNVATPSCKSGKCSYGAATPLVVVNAIAVDTCAAMGENTCLWTGICSIKIITGLQAGPIVGIVIGVLALLSIGGVGFAYYKKIGPYAPGASWSTFLKLSQAAPTKAEVATEPKATDVGVVIRNPTAA